MNQVGELSGGEGVEGFEVVELGLSAARIGDIRAFERAAAVGEG